MKQTLDDLAGGLESPLPAPRADIARHADVRLLKEDPRHHRPRLADDGESGASRDSGLLKALMARTMPPRRRR